MANKNTVANNEYRQELINKLIEFLQANGEDVLITASNTICYPFVNSEGSEEFARLVVSIPTGGRGDKGFDGYEQASQYAEKERDKREKAKIAEEKKKKKIELDKINRELAKEKKENV